MSEANLNNHAGGNEEIDLLDLFRRMSRTLSRWFNAIGEGIIISIVFLIRHWLPLIISVITGLAISVALWKSAKSFYTSDLVLRVNIEPTDELISYVNRLHTLCIQQDKPNLPKALGLTSDQTANILDINAYWVIDNGNDKIPDFVDYNENHNVYDTTNVRMDDRFDIRVRIMQPQVLTEVRDGIIAFINSDPLLKQRNELRLRQNNDLLTRVEIDINELDSLQKFKYFQESKNFLPKNGGQMIFLQEQKTQLLYNDIYGLYNRKKELEQNRDLYQDIVTVISDFTVPSERDNGGLYYAKTFIPLLFGLTLIILILWANRKKLNEVYNKY